MISEGCKRRAPPRPHACAERGRAAEGTLDGRASERFRRLANIWLPMRALFFVAAIAVALVSTPAHAAKGPLPFIPDDYQRALAQARARNVPIVVDVWAPW
jgi:hypothetical protein